MLRVWRFQRIKQQHTENVTKTSRQDGRLWNENKYRKIMRRKYKEHMRENVIGD